jgi:DNA-binding NarL/FixJ family response regulator
MLTAVVVTDDETILEPVEAVLSASSIRMTGHHAVRQLGDDDRAVADVAIVHGPLRTREGPDLRRVGELLPDMPIVALAPVADGRAVRWAIDSGASGVVWQERLESALGPTVLAVCGGQLVFPADARRQYQPPELTTREKQVLSLVVMGLSNGEIAQKLYVSESTVKSHLGTAFRKLGVRSRAEAARLVADPEQGFGTGILAITGPALTRASSG